MEYGSHRSCNVDLTIPEAEPVDRADLMNRIEDLISEVRNLSPVSGCAIAPLESYRSIAEKLYSSRRAIDECFNMSGFATSPAWDIMLDLFQNEEKGKAVSISSACIGAACAGTTALRWIEVLISKSLIARTDDLHDRRRSFVTLTHMGREATINALKASL